MEGQSVVLPRKDGSRFMQWANPRLLSKKTTCLAIINPLSKQRRNLPPIKINSAHDGNRLHATNAAGIGFDDSTNTFKTISVIPKEAVCSLDIDALWAQLAPWFITRDDVMGRDIPNPYISNTRCGRVCAWTFALAGYF
ncbi:hypothetical protein R6Q57_008527 [Mikania cordata]